MEDQEGSERRGFCHQLCCVRMWAVATNDAIQILDDLIALAEKRYVAPYFFAGIHIGLARNEGAIEYLEKCHDEHSHWLIYLHQDPSMDALRDNPRFQALLRRVGLTTPTISTLV
jgi:hypothetical protein